MNELKSLKNPQRAITICMFLAVFVTAIGPQALGEALPFIPQAILTGLVTACAWFLSQYKTEQRVGRAEDIVIEEAEIGFDGFKNQ